MLEATDDVLQSGQLISGKYTKLLELWLGTKTHTQYAVTVHSGTQALYFIAKFFIKKYSTMLHKPAIMVPNLTYPATLNAFLDAGWMVILGDTDKYGILDASSISDSKSLDMIKCIVGLYGRQPDISHKHGAIIDGAQHWLIPDVYTGIGMAISFDPTKNLPASGNGGAVVTDSKELYDYINIEKDNGKAVEFNSTGTNSKMSELDCAHVLVRSKYINIWQQRRTKIAKFWCEAFRDLPLNCLCDDTAPHTYQKFVLYSDNRNSLHTHLLTDGIESKIHYPYALSELGIAQTLTKPDMLSTSVMLSRGVLSLPIYPELTDNEVEYIADKVIDFYR